MLFWDTLFILIMGRADFFSLSKARCCPGVEKHKEIIKSKENSHVTPQGLLKVQLGSRVSLCLSDENGCEELPEVPVTCWSGTCLNREHVLCPSHPVSSRHVGSQGWSWLCAGVSRFCQPLGAGSCAWAALRLHELSCWRVVRSLC